MLPLVLALYSCSERIVAVQVIDSKRVLFPEHLSLSDIQRGMKSGRYLQGTFQASRENYLEANVSTTSRDEMVGVLLSQVVLLQTAHSCANAGVLWVR